MERINYAERYGWHDGQVLRRVYKQQDYEVTIRIASDGTTTYERGTRTFPTLKDATYSIVGEEKRRTWPSLDPQGWWHLANYPSHRR